MVPLMTRKTLSQYSGKNSRIRVITGANRGLGAAQHELVQHVRGDFIAQLDQDEIAFRVDWRYRPIFSENTHKWWWPWADLLR